MVHTPGRGRICDHYLDDFFVMERQDSDECEGALSKLLRVFYQLGFPVVESKFEGPTTCMAFLGLELDPEAERCGCQNPRS